MVNSKRKLKTEKRGGKRPFAGRKKNDYETKIVSFRVRLEWVDVIKSTVKDKISELNKII